MPFLSYRKSTYIINASSGTAEKGKEVHEVSRFREILPQILASTAKNFLLVDLGMSIAFPTIVIPALRGLRNRAPDEILYLTDVQASWFASLAFICQPIGSVLSGIVLEPLGRKKSMILVNIPHIIAWLMLYFSQSLAEIFIAVILLGLGCGFMEAPIVTYVGEITQPSIRGVMTACAGVAATLGFSTVFFLGTQTTWRVAALLCCSVPIMTVIAICFVPETPYWLMSKKRDKDAMKSLQWLRGWVSEKAVEKEFNELKLYSENANKCTPCQKNGALKCTHQPSAKERAKELLRKRTMKPFILVISYFAIVQLSGMSGMRPYMIQIFQSFNVPLDPNWATFVVGFLGLIANIICVVIIKFVGKRNLSLFSMAGTCICCLSLAIYAYKILPPGWSSFDRHDAVQQIGPLNYLPMFLMFGLAFFTSVGIHPVPWMFLSEIFPYKTRAMASGIVAGMNYIFIFISTKTYLNLERLFSLQGVILLYGMIGIGGFLFLYTFVPETERRTLEDIEVHFSDNSKSLSDRKIQKNTSLDQIMSKRKPTDEKEGFDNKAFVETQ